MTKGRNFSGIRRIETPDAEYVRCNFAQPAPIEVGGVKRGVEVFPADATIMFRECNLSNVEPPRNATLDRCLAMLQETKDEPGDSVVIDGLEIASTRKVQTLYAVYDPAAKTWKRHDPPVVTEL